MRALTKGERRASLGVVLGLLGILCLLGVAIGLTLSYKTSSEAGYRLAANTQQTLRDLKATVYLRCLQRQSYDQSNHASVVADVELYRQILELQQVAPVPTDPRARALTIRYRDVIVQAKTRKERAAAQGVIGSCETLR